MRLRNQAPPKIRKLQRSFDPHASPVREAERLSVLTRGVQAADPNAGPFVIVGNAGYPEMEALASLSPYPLKVFFPALPMTSVVFKGLRGDHRNIRVPVNAEKIGTVEGLAPSLVFVATDITLMLLPDKWLHKLPGGCVVFLATGIQDVSRVRSRIGSATLDTLLQDRGAFLLAVTDDHAWAAIQFSG